MPYHPISKDLKAQILVLQQQGYNVKKISNLLGIKKTLIYRSFAHIHHHNIPYNPYTYRPRCRRVLLYEDLNLIIALLNQ
jgi:hypothetical protein